MCYTKLRFDKEEGAKMEIPEIGLGTWNLVGDECVNVVENAIKIGYRHIDTAQMCGNEKEVGKEIKNSGIERSKLFITTKLCSPNTTYDLVISGVKESLKNLQLDYLDLVLIHEPYASSIEMYKALENLQAKGLIKYIGVSNFNRNQIDNLLNNCTVLPYANQIENHIFYQREEYVKYLQSKGIKVVAWSPLCADINKITKNKTINEIAKKYNKTPAQIALRFLLQRDIYIIPKSKNLSRLKENFNLNFTINEDDMNELKKLDEGRSLFGGIEIDDD